MKVAFDDQIFSFQRYAVFRAISSSWRAAYPHGVSEVSVVAPLYVNNYLAGDAGRRFVHGRYVPYTFGGIPVVSVVNRFAAPLAWLGANPDIVHETYFAIKPIGRARRRVVTVYDMIHELFMPEAKRVTAAKRAAVNRADHVICISENTQRDLVRPSDRPGTD